MTYRVELTDRAHADLDRLTAFLAERSPGLADRLTARFHEALPRLESRPLSCGLAYEGREFAEEIRHLLFGVTRRRKYRALFVVRGDAVIVLTIRAPGQAPAGPEIIDFDG